MREKIKIKDGTKEIKHVKQKFVVSPQEDFFRGAHTMVEGQLHDEQGEESDISQRRAASSFAI